MKLDFKEIVELGIEQQEFDSMMEENECYYEHEDAGDRD